MANKLRSLTGATAMGLASLLGPAKSDGAVIVTYTPDQSGTVQNPVYGLSSTDSNYFLSGQTGTSSLPLNFNGNNQQTPLFSNPASVKDAASLDNDYMFQLGTTGDLFKVSTVDGKLNVPFGSLSLGSSTFGIGYDALSNAIGIAQYDGTNMTFNTYNVATDTLGTPVSFAFDQAQYGTPTGADFHNGRMLIGTRDQFSLETENLSNFILDMDATTGTIAQYATINGSTNKLQDLHYADGRLAAAFERAGQGYVQVGDFNPIPEPSTYALIGGFVAFGLAAARRKKH
jgi:hypothetical protein